MSMIPEPYIITRAEAKWLAKALSTDNYRPALTYAYLFHHEGSAWIGTTDTHRLHMLKLGPCEPFTTSLFGLWRVLIEAQFSSASHIAVSRDLKEITVGTVTKKSSEFRKIDAPVFVHDDKLRHINLAQVVPAGGGPLTDLFAMNPRYLADATALCAQYGDGVVMTTTGQTRPIVFVSPKTDRWKAVVMPMGCDIEHLRAQGATK